jgi:hypothetical protein
VGGGVEERASGRAYVYTTPGLLLGAPQVPFHTAPATTEAGPRPSDCVMKQTGLTGPPRLPVSWSPLKTEDALTGAKLARPQCFSSRSQRFTASPPMTNSNVKTEAADEGRMSPSRKELQFLPAWKMWGLQILSQSRDVPAPGALFACPL